MSRNMRKKQCLLCISIHTVSDLIIEKLSEMEQYCISRL